MISLHNPWGNLKFAAGNVASTLSYRIPRQSGTEYFASFRAHAPYKSVLVHLAKTLAVQTVYQQVNSMLPNWRKKIEQGLRDDMVKQQRYLREAVILKQKKQMSSYGQIDCLADRESSKVVGKLRALDRYGTPVPEALMLYFHDDIPHDVMTETADTKQKITSKEAYKNETTFSTCTVCHIDLAPKITVSSSKNIVLTQVQGRDYTRKELVSGGDISFSVSGNIVSHYEGVYPSDDVKKFIQVMQYGGILEVNNFQFDQWNVKRVIIKDFSLGELTYKNIQPYSFSCVAVEPDEAVRMVQDTITTINTELAKSEMNKWYQLILDHKLVELAANSVANTASTLVTDSTALGLDKLVSNI